MECSKGFPCSNVHHRCIRYLFLATWLHSVHAQSLINIDFGVGDESRKFGHAAAGLKSTDFWNLYRHYEPRYEPGMQTVSDGRMTSLRYSDERVSTVDIEVSNAPGVWGNTTGDPMMDTYLFSHDREPISIVLRGLSAGHYQLFLYGYAAADIEPEQHTSFTVRSGENAFGPILCHDFGAWDSEDSWGEGRHFCVFRNVRVEEGIPLVLQATASGMPVVNGLQILSRGTSPPDWHPKKPEDSDEAITELVMPRITYRGRLLGNVWQGRAELTVKSMTTNIVTAPLFSQAVAVKADSLPPGVFLHQNDSSSFITVFEPGQYQLAFDLTVAASRAGPWHSIQFEGPPTAMNRLEIHPIPEQIELEFLTSSGWSRAFPSSPVGEKEQAPLLSRVCILDASRQVAFKWKSNVSGPENSSLWNATAKSHVDLRPGIVQWNTTWKLNVVRGGLEEFTITLPTDQKPINVSGEGVVDWELLPSDETGSVRVHLAEPISNSGSLNLVSEQFFPPTETSIHFEPPQLLGSQRESGTVRFQSLTMDMRLHSQLGMHQVNASDSGLMAFRYHERPSSIDAVVQERKPRINILERIEVVIGETLLTSQHDLSLNVDQAGLHQLRFDLPEGMAVNKVITAGVKDWTVRDGFLELDLKAALMGPANISVLLEHLIGAQTEQVIMNPLQLENAHQVRTVLGVHNAPGIVSQASSAEQLRPMMMDHWEGTPSPHMAYETDQADWSLVLNISRPTSRVVADVFQLLTIGEGKAGGSATIRFAIFNQGMREIKLRLPDHWVNLEFTGPTVRDRKKEDGEWIIGLHEKVWDGYTLVISYEFSFNHQDASLPIRVPTIVGAYRQTGHVAVISHPSVQLQLNTVTPLLRVMDPLDLPEFGKSLLTRPAVLAFEFSTTGAHGVDLTVGRHLRMEGLEAVVDRAEYTTVLTDSAEMLTRVTYMIKNQSRRYQRLQLPAGSTLWSCHVDGESTKVEKDNDWLMIAIPQHTNQDATITVDVVYKEANPELGGWMPKSFELEAPQTDIPSTYAEWTLFAPASRRLSKFQGNMKAAPGVIYDLREAWRLYTDVYAGILKRGLTLLAFLLILGGGITFLVLAKRVRGWNGVVNVAILSMVLFILAGMLLPALSTAKSKAQKIKTINNLKNIAMAARIFETDHGRFPATFAEMMEELSSERILVDLVTGRQLIYAGAGKSSEQPASILAYSPAYDRGMRTVAMTDGSVSLMSQRDFQTALDAHTNLLAQLSSGQASTALPASQLEPNDADIPAATESRDATTATPISESLTAGTTRNRPSTGSLRSILIEIPETGISYQFSKTLNHGEEPLVLRMNIMNGKVYRGFLRCVCAFLFLGGTLVASLEWQRKTPRAWLVTLGTIIGITSVTGFLIMLRALHYVLMFGTPILLLAVLFSAIKPIYTRLLRFGRQEASNTASLMIALFLLLNGMVGNSLQAAESQTEIESTDLPKVTLMSAHYEGTATEDSVTLRAEYQLYCRTPMTKFLLFKAAVAVDAFRVPMGQAQLTRQDAAIELLIEKPGETLVTMNLVLKTHSAGAYRVFSPSLPTAMASELQLKLPEAEIQVESPSASSLAKRVIPGGLLVEAIFGPTSPPILKWISQKQSTIGRKPNLHVSTFSLLRFQDGFVNLKSEFQCHMIQGKQVEFPIHIPAGYDVVSVNAPGMAHWEVQSTLNKQTLMATLTSPLTDQIDFSLELTKPLKHLPIELIVSVPSLEQAHREVGWVGLENFDEHDLILVSLNEWRRAEQSGIPASHLVKQETLGHVFQYPQPGGSAAIILTPTLPRLNAKAWYDYSVNAQGVRLKSTVKLDIEDAGLFQLQFGLPKNLELDLIKGEGVQQWQVVEGTQDRILKIQFSRRILGEYELSMEMHQTWESLPDQLEFHGLEVSQAEKHASWILIRSEPGIALISTERQGMVEISPDNVRSPHQNLSEPTLAFRSTQTSTDQTSTLVVAEIRKLDPWMTANITHQHVFHESFVEGLTIIQYLIQDAPVADLDLQIPEAFKNIHVLGANILSHQKAGNGTWNIRLRKQVMNEFEIRIQWERDLRLTSEGVDIPIECIHAMNTKRETGLLVAKVRPPLQITSKNKSGSLAKLSPRAAAQAMIGSAKLRENRREFEIALAYQYLQPDFEMSWNLVRNLDALLLDALADQVTFTTVLAEDGQLIARASYTIRNRGKRHVVLELPDNTTPWSVFVSNQSIRPGVDNRRLLIPIEGFGAEDSVQTVDVTYVGKVNFPLTMGSLTLESPSIDVPLKEITWEVLMPWGYRYESHSKDLKQQTATEWVEEDFSSLEYRRQDVERRAEIRRGSLDSLMQARYALSGGSLGQAVQMLSAEKQKGFQGDLASTRMQEIESELTKVQARNLLAAEQTFVRANRGRYTTDGSASTGGSSSDTNDLSDQYAQRQWRKVQQSQRFSDSPPEPMRINLPTRGLRTTFTKALQAEIGRPLLLEIEATHEARTGHWSRWLKAGIFILSAHGIILWLLAKKLNIRFQSYPSS